MLIIALNQSLNEPLTQRTRKAGSHLSRKCRQNRRTDAIGTKVFIGHGRSLVWKELKDFIQDRLSLPWDEFNRVPIAGISNISRLVEMLNSAAISFLIMTGEDEQLDGNLHARMNVIHEAGLFQGSAWICAGNRGRVMKKLGVQSTAQLFPMVLRVLRESGCKILEDIKELGRETAASNRPKVRVTEPQDRQRSSTTWRIAPAGN